MPFLVRVVAFLVVLSISSVCHAQQKQVYWPDQFDKYPEVTLKRSAESDNFIVLWGELAGMDPTQAPPDIDFDPASILQQLESTYTTYIDEIGFLDDEVGNLALYKIIVVMNNTWSNAPWTGWAFGGQYDNTIGAMWIHPNATHDPSFTLAHELAHSFQCQIYIDHPGHGFINYEPHGFFWECHAQYMAENHYPTLLEAVDYIRFFNTAHYHWSSTRHHYGNTLFLRQIEETNGIEAINRLGRETIAGKEHPLTAFKRIMGVSQPELNDLFGDYALRNVFFDYGFGEEMRHTVENEFDHNLITRRFTALLPMENQENCWKVPDYIAPQDYGYNTVQLQINEGASTVDLTFYGHPNEAAGGAGFRFGFVAMNSGAPRYSELHDAAEGEEVAVSFDIQLDDEELYFVVLGAPDTHHDYFWEPGWPKIYRYPWQIQIHGAVPFVNNHRGIDGSSHPNGGGFVASSAYVAPTAYVGPQAQVLSNGQVLENARIEGQATVTHSSTVSGQALVRNAAFVGWSNVSGNAIIEESAMQFGTVSDTFHAGGDAEGHGTCYEGYYRQTAHFNNGRTSCDGLEEHPANDDVNPTHADHVFSDACPGDFDGNGAVDVNDLLALISSYGQKNNDHDLDDDGVITVNDVLLMLDYFGNICS
ncbi:MAG: DUF6055 domain-containing protein [Planctomycetota bacterium]|nr:DUF6055 domain-containing protein [Planctomycetota bacterium]